MRLPAGRQVLDDLIVLCVLDVIMVPCVLIPPIGLMRFSRSGRYHAYVN